MVGDWLSSYPTMKTSRRSLPAAFVWVSPVVQAPTRDMMHASPTPLPLESAWLVLAVFLQLSQASPTVSPSRSAWVGLAIVGQLSTLPQTPSPSASFAGSSGHGSHASPKASLSALL